MKKEIQLPLEIFDGRFTLEEIGALSILMSLFHLEETNKEKWFDDEYLQQIVLHLSKKGHLNLSEDGKIIEIILEPQQEPEKMNIVNAIKELKETWGYETEELRHIQDLMEELCSSVYCQGYDDARIDFGEKPFTAYGKSEDR